MGPLRPTSWIEWYRFARATLDCTHAEAVLYANLRTTEDRNRGERPLRPAA